MIEQNVQKLLAVYTMNIVLKYPNDQHQIARGRRSILYSTSAHARDNEQSVTETKL